MTNDKEKEILELLNDLDLLCPDAKRTLIINSIKSIMQSEPEQHRFVKGSIVEVAESPEYNKYYIEYDKVYTDVNWETIKPIDFPTFARIIAQHIPEARKAILFPEEIMQFEDKNGNIIEWCGKGRIPIPITILYPNPSGKRQEIDIEWED